MGQLEVICGPMYSGKTEELLRRLRRSQIAGKSINLLRPSIDNRYSEVELISHNGTRMKSRPIETIGDLHTQTIGSAVDVVGIDEVQFLDERFAHEIQWISHYRHLIVTGLDTNYRNEPFGIVPFLLAVADKADKLSAVCHVCGGDATKTQRLVDGEPAPFSGPEILVGARDSYEARCRECFRIG